MPAGDWPGGDRGLAAVKGREKQFAESVETTCAYGEIL
eukprot:CAMPEP_0185203428 /NCGR_PEP_ID=MMETSP1140-20130426/52991_1 /TAXON_ID=298111 /ORGANISM="Pavlova sp., Strain CCMP459" /LENGTH=37 /DNA_ID= /DNA_START= /DNA_END= /DNA_ORIENTATION=